MDWEEFKRKVSALLDAAKNDINLKCLDNCIKYNIEGIEFAYSKKDYEMFVSKLDNYVYEYYQVFTSKSYEIIIFEINTKKYDADSSWKSNKVIDSINNITYEYTKISDVMLYNLLKELDYNNIHYLKFNFYTIIERPETLNLFHLLKILLNDPHSLLLKFDYTDNYYKLRSCAESLLFNICFNFNETYKLAKNLNDVIGPGFDYKSIDSKAEVLTAPKILYNSYLIEQYSLAKSAEDSMIQFIGYYHIIEYYFEDVYKENLRDKLKNILVQPNFSPTNVEDINKIIKEFGNKGSDCSPGNELDGLILVLKNYVIIDNLVDKIKLSDYKSFEFYKEHEVSFSGGPKVDLLSYVDVVSEEKKDKLYNKLAKRIYATRNSIVHGKSNELRYSERPIYRPFEDEKSLRKEIPLMKAIAEEIIINTAEEI